MQYQNSFELVRQCHFLLEFNFSIKIKMLELAFLLNWKVFEYVFFDWYFNVLTAIVDNKERLYQHFLCI